MFGIEWFSNPEIVDWLSTYGYLIMVPLLAMEGPATAFVAGVLSAGGAFNPFVVIGLFTLVRLLTDSFLYHASSHGTHLLTQAPIIGRYARMIRASQHSTFGNTTAFFHRYFLQIFVATKIIPIPNLASATAIAAGTLKVSKRRFYTGLLVAQPLWSILIVSAGYYMGSVSDNMMDASYVVPFASFIAIAIIFAIFRDSIRLYLYERTPLGKIMSGLDEDDEVENNQPA